ncbi:MAG TPA: hypothetical protein VE263_22785 [Candidatus Angelobacter sp.]|nr:hypothetical protein [Candidatus Angelobacter sp.]
MFTLFSTPKPFAGPIDVIQRNAIRSWQRLHTGVEVLLFGDDPGAAEACRDLGIRHVPNVQRNPHGTKYLGGIFDQAQEIAAHDVLCYVNCDIILMSDFRRAVESVSRLHKNFLLAGRRWDVDIRNPLDFQQIAWEEEVRQLAFKTNRQRPAQWMDYFVFGKGLYYQKIPGFVVGRPGWDPWLLWYALHAGVPVVDASAALCAVHQNHDYSYHSDGEKGVWEGEEAQENSRLLEDGRKFRTLRDATFVLNKSGLHRNYARWAARLERGLRGWLSSIWFRLLDATRPVRHKIGLRQKAKNDPSAAAR